MASIIKVDALQEKTSGNGIVLENSLKDSTGTNEIISPSGGITIPSGQSIKNSSGTSLVDATGTISSDMVFPAGHVIQIVYNIPETVTLASTTTTSYAEIQTVMRTSITPKFSNSLLILEWDALHGGNNTSNILAAKFYDVTNNTDVHSTVPALGTGSARVFSHGSERQQDNDSNDRSTFKMKTVVSAQNTNLRTYSIYAKTEGVTHYWNMTVTDNSGCTYAPFCFTIMEIAQ